MKGKHLTIRRISSLLLAIMMCITFMPAVALAESEDSDTAVQELIGETAAAEAAEEAAVEEPAAEEAAAAEPAAEEEPAVESEAEVETYPELYAEGEEAAQEAAQEEPKEEPQPEPVDPGPVGTSFTHDGVQVTFASAVAQTVPDFMENATPGRVWIKAGKKNINVNWNNAANISTLTTVDGVIVLRADGKSEAFSEIARVAFAKDGDTIREAKTAYGDSSASKKNTAYKYRIVSYHVKDGYTFISHISDWAAGQTSASKLKSFYTAKINSNSLNLQYNESSALKLTVAKPKAKFMPKSFRWYSDDSSIASVDSKGNVTARGVGSTTVYGRLASGDQISCRVSVTGAIKPAAPKLSVDYATTSSITLKWDKVVHATSYDVYRSDDGLHWNAPVNAKGTSYTFSGLTENHRYTFYVIARNDNSPYSAESTNSNVVYEKAAVDLRATAVTGFPSKKTAKSGTTLKIKIKVKFPEARKASLQMKDGKKWTTKKTVKLPKGTGNSKVTLTFPKDWWGGETEWRLYIPKSQTAAEYTTGTLTITAARRYQNPKGYVQISDSISKHGYKHFVSPVLVNSASSKVDHVSALIKTAKKYKGDKYAQSKSGAPGKGIDESGLIIQACYGAGVDLWPISPSTRPYNCLPKIMGSKFKKITYKQAAEGSNDYVGMTKGDLIFFSTSKNGNPIHAAIYLGLGDIIHADPVKGNVNTSTIRTLEDKEGKYKYYVVGVRRIFN
ncbi:MAG: fibronectin type III domain-containing protein [Mogibacterium sp.]|nr:fibronectin type III domain-containing protein [Mogibacterium sp.]